MNSQQAKNWLNRSFDLWRQHKALCKRREAQTFANISQYEDDFTSPAGNSSEEKMIAYAELNAKIEEVEKKLFFEDNLTKSVIDQVEDPVLWALLRDRYIDRRGWREIAKAYAYSEQHIYRIHGRALQEVARYIPKEAFDEN